MLSVRESGSSLTSGIFKDVKMECLLQLRLRSSTLLIHRFRLLCTAPGNCLLSCSARRVIFFFFFEVKSSFALRTFPVLQNKISSQFSSMYGNKQKRQINPKLSLFCNRRNKYSDFLLVIVGNSAQTSHKSCYL